MKRIVALAVLSMCAACSNTSSPTSQHNPAALGPASSYRPQIRPEDFVAKIDNPYLPWEAGTTWKYEGVSDGERETTVVRVTNKTKKILGIDATVVQDTVYVAGELAEDTYDWYAQDSNGNVWYLGEDTKEYENGKVSSREGSWTAGVDGAQPGIAMLGSPRAGDAYRQEYRKGEAEDQGRVIALDGTEKVPAGSYRNVVVTEERNPLEPKILERKYYARGVGLILERNVKGGQEESKLVEMSG